MQRYAPAVPELLRMGAELPALLGEDGPVHYLVLAQNSDEIRATGGFITGLGVVSVDKGELVGMTIGDSYDFDLFSVDHPYAPQAMQDHMGIILWVTRDGNWSPDFPTSARDTVELFNLEHPEPISGTIAFDMMAIPPLVEAVDQLHVEGVAEPVTKDNVLGLLRASWGPDVPEGMTWEEWRERTGWATVRSEWWEHRKDIMGNMAEALLSEIQGGGGVRKLARVLPCVVQLVQEKHLLLHFGQHPAQNVLEALDWDGSVRPLESSDHLMVLDTNMGYNKVNLHVQKAIEYGVELDEQGNASARLGVSWRNPNPALPECVHESKLAATYDDMAEGCYWNYLRVYVPLGSRLDNTLGLAHAAETGEDLGMTIFTDFFVVPAAEERDIVLEYQVPVCFENEYRLLVRKQAGTHAVPIRITLALPEGTELDWSSRPPDSTDGRRVGFDAWLQEDIALTVAWH
jgi:hypothetical protein